jgi:hypothetical protein
MEFSLGFSIVDSDIFRAAPSDHAVCKRWFSREPRELSQMAQLLEEGIM